MSDKVNVEEIIGLVKTDEVIDGVEEVRKLRGRGGKMKEYTLDEGVWYHSYPEMDKEGNEKIEEEIVEIIDVPVEVLLLEWENLVSELWEKESKLVLLKKKFNRKEFEIVYTSDIDFKSLYDSTAEKVRKQHAKSVLKDLDVEIQALELSINWIKGYVPLLRECIRIKGE